VAGGVGLRLQPDRHLDGRGAGCARRPCGAARLPGGILGARRIAASPAALWGATVGTFVGLFLGLPGLLLGPFIGALVGELRAGSTLQRSTHVGLSTWIGLLFGTLAKIALSFTMLGIFVGALFI
jgi:uncharacterized protein YqgC (DUF456 family)